MHLGIPVYEGVNLLDVAGPWEMFGWVDPGNGLQTTLLSADGRPVLTQSGVQFGVHASFWATPALDVLCVPGGSPGALGNIMSDHDGPYLRYLQKVPAKGCGWGKMGVFRLRGALLLAAASLLDGHKATTHWAFVNCLKRFPKIEVDTTNSRFIVSQNDFGNRLTGGGISAGLDESLKLITLLYDDATAQDVQVTTQYFPVSPISGKIPPPGDCPVKW